MNPRKKYANGTSNIDPNNYIISPAQAMNDYNIMLGAVEAKAASDPMIPIAAAIGGVMQQGISIAGGAAMKKINERTPEAANGMNDVQADVEVEGGEMYETPQGQVGEFEGPSHEQGGIPLEVVDTPVANPNNGDVQKETKVYSDQLIVAGQTLAERKEARERKTANLEKIASQALVDQAVKNAAKRKMMAIEKEEMADLDFQEKVNNIQVMADTMVAAFGTGMAGLQDNPVGDSMEYGYGSGSKGVMKYELGTDEDGIDPIYGNEDNRIKNLHDILKIPSTNEGYGKVIGTETKKRLLPYIKDSWVSTMEKGNPDQPAGYYAKLYDDGDKASRLYEDNTILALKGQMKKDSNVYTNNLYSSLGLTPGGRQFKQEVNSLDPIEIPTSKGMAENFLKEVPFETMPIGKTEIDANASAVTKKQSKAGKFISENMPGVGDLTKMFGNYLGMTAGIKTAGEQRSTDVTHTNVYKNAGEESQKLLDNAKQGIEASKAQAIVKTTSTSRGGKRGGRNSARGVNQMRGIDWLYDTALESQIADISAKAAEQISSIDVQKSGVAMSADQLKGKGEFDAAMANEAAKDAYYTALGKGRNQFAEGLMQTGKDLNDMRENKMKWNMQKKSGTYVQGEDDGTLSNKDIVYTDENGKKVSIPRAQFEKLLKQQKSKLT